MFSFGKSLYPTDAQNPDIWTPRCFCPPLFLCEPLRSIFGVYMQAIRHTQLLLKVSSHSETSKWSLDCQNHSDLRFFPRCSGPIARCPIESCKKSCLVFTFKPPLIHLELQNTPQTLSGCITREYYRFWEFQHNRSTRTGLTVIKLLRRDFSGSKGLQLSIVQISLGSGAKSKRCSFITVSPVLVLRSCWNSQKR